MRKFYAFILFVLSSVIVFGQTTYTSTGSGNYTDAIWSPSNPPTTIAAGDKVVVQSGHTVTINTNVTIYGEYENNGTVSLTSRLYVRSGGVLTQNGNCAGTYSQLYVLSGGTVDCTLNGGTIPSATKFYAGSFLVFSGITTTSPSLSSGDQFGSVVINCSSLSTTLDLPQLDIQNDLTVTNTGSGSLNFVADPNETIITGNMSIGSSGKVIIEPGAKVTVSGTLSNSSGTDGLIMQSNSTTTHTGSLIASQDVSGTVQRYIPGSRWYMFGPGTSSSTSNLVSGAYLQYYTESTNAWTYVTATNYSFSEGVGYAYYGTSNKTINFSGTLYNSDKSFSNLSMSDEGWHILSNPFSAALTWGGPNWSLSNVSSTAKIYNGSNWIDKSSGGILAANQGFAIQVSSATNSLTIPAADKVHNSQSFQKSEKSEQYLAFNLTDDISDALDIFYLRIYDDATDNFDLAYDAEEFLPEESSSGKLFAQISDLKQSTLAISQITDNRTVNLGFISAEASFYTIALDKFAIENIDLILEDVNENKMISMEEGDSYVFEKTDNDTDRFKLHLKSANGISGEEEIEGINVWSYFDNIYIHNENTNSYNLEIFNVSGQLVYSAENILDEYFKTNLSNPKGVYIVKISSENKIFTKSIVK